MSKRCARTSLHWATQSTGFWICKSRRSLLAKWRRFRRVRPKQRLMAMSKWMSNLQVKKHNKSILNNRRPKLRLKSNSFSSTNSSRRLSWDSTCRFRPSRKFTRKKKCKKIVSTPLTRQLFALWRRGNVWNSVRWWVTCSRRWRSSSRSLRWSRDVWSA